MPGPIPKRSDLRRNRNVKTGPPLTKAPSGQPADSADDLWVEPGPDWHPIALLWYTSLAESGQSAFYEASDVALAYFVAELITRALNAGKTSGQIIATIDSMMDKLLTSEGARRRARVELERPDDGDGAENPIAIQLERYRKAAQ